MLRTITNLFVAIETFVVRKQKYFQWLFNISVVAMVGFFILTIVSNNFARSWNDFGKKAANLSLITFWITLVPGILGRMNVGSIFLPIKVILMMFRKEIGILMYLFAIAHYSWSRFLPIFSINGNLFSITYFEVFGLIAFVLSFPLFVTSNDFSIAKLGHIWKKLHTMTYVIVWMLFLHLIARELDWKAVVTLVIASFEWASLINKKLFSKKLVS
jgi:DMSO/TMAO reductase YedYZ heme-binding membrane subunit